ncbi:MAG: putative selenium-dependent hydroxylase accessory protein YqeC [Proteobacteria bacterium]|nr:putative selenium-dependent hydroxylase accessory protein YqeC [Pseudomonadota bacterium]
MNGSVNKGKALMEIDRFFPLTPGMALSFVGGGGKTSLMFALATQLAGQGNSVLVTTTTAIFHPDHEGRHHDGLVLGEDLFNLVPGAGQMVVAAKSYDPESRKLKGFSPGLLARVREKKRFDYMLVEADGSRRRPVKAPADHEPVIPGWTDMVIGCIGLDCLGRPMDAKTVHRPEFFAAVTGLMPGDPILADHLVALVASDLGLFKNTLKNMKKMVVFNKADTRDLVQQGQVLAARIRNECPWVDGCHVGCLLNPEDPVIF